MRRNAGSFVRGKLVRLSMWGVAGAGIVIGLSIGLLFYVVGDWIGRLWGIAAYTATSGSVKKMVTIVYKSPLVGGLAPAFSGAVVNKKGLRARGVYADAEAGQLVVPCNPGLVVGLERVDGALGQGA